MLKEDIPMYQCKRLPCLCVVGELFQFRIPHSDVKNSKWIHSLLLEVKVMNMFLVLYELL
jgi:hypothetical protein